MPDCPIVDCHVHFLDPAVQSYPWLEAVPLINRTFGPSDYQAACGSVTVEQFVFVEADAVPEQRFAEAEFVTRLPIKGPKLGGIVASALVEHGAAVREEIERLLAIGPLRGIRRQIQNRPEQGWCLQPGFVEGVRVLADFGLPFDICIKSHQLGDATELVRRCPDVTFVLNHLGKPGIAAGSREPWWQEIQAMARLPNVVCKIAGVTTEADHAAWTIAQIRPYIDHTLDCFGLDRCLFASDWPVMNLSHSFAGWIATLDEILDGASASELRGFYRDNAIRVYRL